MIPLTLHRYADFAKQVKHAHSSDIALERNQIAPRDEFFLALHSLHRTSYRVHGSLGRSLGRWLGQSVSQFATRSLGGVAKPVIQPGAGILPK